MGLEQVPGICVDKGMCIKPNPVAFEILPFCTYILTSIAGITSGSSLLGCLWDILLFSVYFIRFKQNNDLSAQSWL
jgi:hypothetical protein